MEHNVLRVAPWSNNYVIISCLSLYSFEKKSQTQEVSREVFDKLDSFSCIVLVVLVVTVLVIE